MDITGHVTRRRALAAAGALLAALCLGGALLLRGGAAPAPAAPAAGDPPIPVGTDAAAGRPTRAAATAAADQFGAGPASSSPAHLVVHVVGAVRRPGLYTLPEGARAADAVTRAGGATGAANLEAIDLAAPIADGQQVAVPRRDGAGADPAPATPPEGAGPAARMGTLHLNVATAEQLDALPGIGPSTAQKIVDYRAEHGPFRSVDELDAISGIGAAKIEQLRDLVAP